MIDSITAFISFAKANYRGKMVGGGFEIKKTQFEMQFFSYIPYGSYKNFVEKGDIINDTTIYISSCKTKKGYGYDKCSYNNYYLNFLQMPKPDSTNQWMKRKWYWNKK